MAETPRVEFPFFLGNASTLRAWMGFRDMVLQSRTSVDAATAGSRSWVRNSLPLTEPAPPEPLPPASQEAGVWRLLAANNREIARGSHVYSGFDVARSHVLKLRDRAGDFSIVQVLGPQRGMRGWFVSLNGTAVLTCSRWYEAASSSADAACDAVETFRTAVVADTVRPTVNTTRRSAGRDAGREASRDAGRNAGRNDAGANERAERNTVPVVLPSNAAVTDGDHHKAGSRSKHSSAGSPSTN
ncbi:MAG: hypothetical protein JWQ43_1844 [Glaciihabitans sp.]|nr:hypothetical protein [Glaciihabitans sp.]